MLERVLLVIAGGQNLFCFFWLRYQAIISCNYFESCYRWISELSVLNRIHYSNACSSLLRWAGHGRRGLPAATASNKWLGEGEDDGGICLSKLPRCLSHGFGWDWGNSCPRGASSHRAGGGGEPAPGFWCGIEIRMRQQPKTARPWARLVLSLLVLHPPGSPAAKVTSQWVQKAPNPSSALPASSRAHFRCMTAQFGSATRASGAGE